MALGDVAEVTFAHPPLIGDAFVNGGNGLLLVIEKFPSANTLEVTRGVEQALAELKRGLPGVEIDANVFRLASYIEDSISNLTQAIIVGALLVMLVIGAFLFNWRSALISVVSIAAVAARRRARAPADRRDDQYDDPGRPGARARRHHRRRHRRRREAHARGCASAGTAAAHGLGLIYETTLETRSVAIYATLIVDARASRRSSSWAACPGAFFEPLRSRTCSRWWHRCSSR